MWLWCTWVRVPPDTYCGVEQLPFSRAEDRKRYDALDHRARNARNRAEILRLLGGKCRRCGFDDERVLQIDHVNGGGSAEVRPGNRYQVILSRLNMGSTDYYQLLCANCNWIKKAERMETVKRLY